MPIHFRLPTFNSVFTPYKYDIISKTYSVEDDFDGQLYTMKRVAEVSGIESMYIVYPKEVTDLRDPSVLTPQTGNVYLDCVAFTWEGEWQLWQVAQCVPRWMNFPNQHRMVLIDRLSWPGIGRVLSRLPGVVPDDTTSVFTFSPTSPLADGTTPLLVKLRVLNDGGYPMADRTITLVSSSGTVTITEPFLITDNYGDVTFHAYNTVVETTTFTATVVEDSVTIGPSAGVAWSAGASWDLGTSTLTAVPNPAPIDSGWNMLVTFTALDAFSVPVVDASVRILRTGGTGTILGSPSLGESLITDSNGQVSCMCRAQFPADGDLFVYDNATGQQTAMLPVSFT